MRRRAARRWKLLMQQEQVTAAEGKHHRRQEHCQEKIKPIRDREARIMMPGRSVVRPTRLESRCARRGRQQVRRLQILRRLAGTPWRSKRAPIKSGARDAHGPRARDSLRNQLRPRHSVNLYTATGQKAAETKCRARDRYRNQK